MAFNFGAGGPAPAPTGGGGGFSFGASAGGAPANAPQPAAAAGGFSFGATAAPAAGQPAAAPLPSFGGGGAGFGGAPQQPAATVPPTAGFGATAPVPGAANTGAPAPSFSFGSTAATTPAPGPVGAAPAAGVSFGGPAAPAVNATPGAAPTTGGLPSFGAPASTALAATATTPGAPAVGGFSLTGATALTATTSTALTAQAPPTGFVVPAFDSLFPNEQIHANIKRLLAASISPGEQGREAASELVDLLKCDNNNPKAVGTLLAAPKPLQYTPADQNLRNQLGANPEFVRYGKPARLERETLQDIFKVADDLRISEEQALSLCGEVMQTNCIPMLEAKLVDGSIIDQALSAKASPSTGPVVLGTNAVKAAKELYFFERQRRLRTILMLVQSRIEATGQPWGHLIIQATDSLLQCKLIDNLIELIREWTQLIGCISRELANRESNNAYSGYHQEKKQAHFDAVHLLFAVRGRESASESLFFIAYHTQLSATEVAGLVDLTRDLSNGLDGDAGLPLLDPFHDVPSSYETPPQTNQGWAPYQNNSQSLKEKEHLRWQRELVQKTKKSGKCELLRCVSALTMAIISALDTRNTFVDRTTHSDNQIGVGNMLLPTGEQPGAGLDPIHQRLTSEGCRQWKRTDICGLLCGAYAMLLKAPTSLTSPRAGGSPSRSRSLVRTFAECLSAPMCLKSITFAQLCLLPALQRPSNHTGAACETSEFLLSVLSEYVANFLDVLSSSGNFPVSRTSWKKEQLEALQLDRETQQQQKEFSMWAGNYDDQDRKEKPVANSVDLMQRPDCMDDIIALAVAVASQGPMYAMKFWDFSNETDASGNPTMALVPSRAYKQLKALASEDDSLTPFYMAYSAVLAKAESPYSDVCGADVVNSILVSPDSTTINWHSVFETLRWYFRTLDISKTNSPAVTRSSNTSSTSYYYQNTSATNSSTQGSAKSSSASKPMEMGETNTFYLLSLLGLVSSVSSKSPKSRLEILSMKLPIKTPNSNTVLGSDPTLNIMFSLLTGPLPPEVRGASLAAIASLLCTEGLHEEEKSRMRDFAASAWALVESCQILPIILLDQYPQAVRGATPKISGLNFPASSVSLAGSGSKNSVIPLDQNFAILYEMVHVEAKQGLYPSTEGFLSLLAALFRSCCPPELGQGMRLRLGCTPYIEYVMHFVLPMTTGSESKMGKLPFRSKADEARLFAKATEVIRTVLVQYSVETFPNIAQASQLLGQESLVAKVVVGNSASSTGNNREDFSSKSVNYDQRGNAQQSGMLSPASLSQQQQIRGASLSSIPSPKSPGFVVLSDLLSMSDGCILKALSTVLAENLTAFADAGDESSTLAETYALFKETPPTLTSAKYAGKTEIIPSSMRAQLLKGLRPNLDESMGYSTAVSWRECGVVNALQILCAAAVREEDFYKAVNAALTPIRIVPVLRFDMRRGSTVQITSNNVHISRFQDVLLAAREVVYSFTSYVGYSATTDETDSSIAMSGLSLIYFLQQALPGQGGMESICGTSRGAYKKLSHAVAQRLVTSYERSFPADFSMLSLIFDWMVSSLRRGDSRLAHILLGLPGLDSGRSSSIPLSEGGPDDCFGSILNMLNGLSFVIEKDTSKFAASCFEILVRITDLKAVSDSTALHQVLHCAERLRSVGFYRKHLELFLMHESVLLQSACSSGDPNVIHSMAWLLQGISSELHLMAGFCPARNGAVDLIDYIAPRIGELDSLLSLLFSPDGQGIESAIHHIPIQNGESLASAPPQDAVRLAQQQLAGPPEFTNGYFVVEEKILLSKLKTTTGNEEQRAAYQSWCQSWNERVKMDCAAFHLSNTLRVLVGAALSSCHTDDDSRVNSMASLLVAVLERIIGVSPGAQVSPMTARGLSFIALLLSRDITFVAKEKQTGMTDLRTIRDMLARSVVASGREPGGTGSWKPLLQERTAILGAALVEVVQVLPQEETESEAQLFHKVAVILTELSAMVNLGEVSPVPGQPTAEINGRKVALPTEATMVARSSLTTLLELIDQDASSPVDSITFGVLSERLFGNNETCAKLLLSRVTVLDEGVIVLLDKLVQGPFIGNLFIEEGLLESLLYAADTYMYAEQAQLNGSFQQNGAQNLSIDFPSILYNQLLLFRTLFVTSDLLSEKHCSDLPASFYAFAQKYHDVFARAFGAMSRHGKELCVLAQTISLASSLLAKASTGALFIGNPLQPVDATRMTNQGTFVEGAIQDLVLSISENPLPGKSSQLPRSLTTQKNDAFQPSAVVQVSNTKNAWWSMDSATQTSRIENWSVDTFQHALLGVDIMNAGLGVLMKQPLKNFSVEMSFVRGLFQLTRAGQTVQEQLELLFDISPQIDFMETDTLVRSSLPQSVQVDYLRRIGRKLKCCIHKVLLALIHRVKKFRAEPENSFTHSVGEYCKAVSDAMDHLELNSRGIPCSLGPHETAQGVELAKILGSLLIF